MNVVKLLNLAELLRKNAADEKGMKFDLSFVNRVAEGETLWSQLWHCRLCCWFSLCVRRIP
jgi:hypothetical protein